MAIYNNIKNACKEAGTSISKLEETLGFARGSIYKWDNHCPSVEKLQAVARQLDKPMDYFLE